jgi:hypothetical protein
LAGLYAVQHFNRAAHKNRRLKMVENRMEYIAVSTGVVLTALVALIPFVG